MEPKAPKAGEPQATLSEDWDRFLEEAREVRRLCEEVGEKISARLQEKELQGE